MSYRTQLSRYTVAVLGLVALAAGTTTATRWMPWSQLGSCLFCGGSNGSAPTARPEASRAATVTGTLSGRLGHSVTRPEQDFGPNAIGPAQASARTPDMLTARADASSDGWQPWGHSTQRNGGSDNSSVLTGLAHLASTSISGGGSAVHRPVSSPASVGSEVVDKPMPAVETPAPAPPSTPAPTPHGPVAGGPTSVTAAPLPPGPGGFSPSLPTTVTTAGPDATAPFHQQNDPPPTPFVPPPPAGALNANDAAGTLPTNGPASPSPTPEPASMLLLATGVAAVFGELRRRRVM